MAITKLNSLAIPDNTIVEADLSYPLTNFSSTGIDDNATSTAITIDSSQNVAIGTHSPADLIHGHIGSAATTGLRLTNSATGSTSSDGFQIYCGVTGQAVLRQRENSEMLFMTNNAEQMRIEGGGAVLIGKDVRDSTTIGTYFDPTYGGVIVRDGANPILLNRLSSDGDIALFRKDSTTIGRIGTSTSIAGKFFISGESGVQFRSDDILPTNSSGAYSNGSLDIGDSGARFRNGYFSGSVFAEGGAYIGGTAAVNHLEDYEEGTWTPVANNLTINYSSVVSSGSYVKIGKLVTATFEIQWSSANVGAGYAALNLPLLSSTDFGSGILIEVDQAPVSIDQLSMYTTSGQSLMYFRKRNAGGVSQICARTDLFTSSNRISGTITYYTS